MENQKVTNEELKKVVDAYNKGLPLSEKKITMTVRTAKYITVGILLIGAFATRQFLSIGRA